MAEDKSSAISKRHLAETKKLEAEAESLRLDSEGKRIDLDSARYDKTYGDATDWHNRTISMVGVIDDETIDDIVTKVNAWARVSQEPIIVRLNSPGGDVHAGLALYDQLKSVDITKAPVYTVAMGMTASMAGIIFQAGRKRIITPYATFLVHEVSVGGLGHINRSELEDINKSVARLNTRLYTILAERSTLSVDEIDKNAQRKDWEIDADEAVRLGFADTIGYQ